MNSAVPSCAANGPRMPDGNTSPGSTSERIWKMAVGAVLVLLFIYLLYPKLADVFLRAGSPAAPVRTEQAAEEFDPYAPITVVPNDYQEE